MAEDDESVSIETAEEWLVVCELGRASLDAWSQQFITSIREVIDKRRRFKSREPLTPKQLKSLRLIYQKVLDTSSISADRAIAIARRASRVSERRPSRYQVRLAHPQANSKRNSPNQVSSEQVSSEQVRVRRAGSLRGSPAQRKWAYEIRDFMVDTLAKYLKNPQTAKDLSTTSEVERLLLMVRSQTESKWFIDRKTAIFVPVPDDPIERVRRALFFANWTVQDELTREFANRIAREISSRLDILPACNCILQPPTCPDRRRWYLIGHPHQPWLRIFEEEDELRAYAHLETGNPISPNVHATIRYDGSWYGIDPLGGEFFGLDDIAKALKAGELPE